MLLLGDLKRIGKLRRLFNGVLTIQCATIALNWHNREYSMRDTGHFNLKTADDLARKLSHDYRVLEQDPSDPYRAFNFFITAEHLPDWLRDKDIRNQSALLRICSHLANNAKHFTTDRHNAVERTEKEVYCEPGYAAEDYFAEPLVVHFTEDVVREMGCSHMEVLDLAKLILSFWRARFPEI